MILALIASHVICSKGPEPVTISHVNVVDVLSGHVRRDVTVRVRDGLIESISGPSKIPDPSAVDGSGKYLIPGLWDCHVHCWSDQIFFPLFLANGVTGIRDMFGSAPMLAKWRKDVDTGATVGPRIYYSGPIVDGPKPIWPGSIAVGTAEQGKQAVDKVQAMGCDFVKVYSLLPREAYFAIAEEAKKRNIDFEGHVPNAITAVEASKAGQKSFEHLYSVLAGCCDKETELLNDPSLTRMQKVRAMLDSYNSRKASSLFAVFKKNGTWQCPTLTVLNSIANLDQPAFLKDPRLSFLPNWITSSWDPSKDFRLKALKSEDYEAMRLRLQKEEQVVGEMAKSGVKMLAGTDTPNPYAFPGFGLHDELALMVKSGLSPLQALQTATINPARFFGIEKSTGSIQVGKAADLVLLDANPLVDIHNTTRISAVFVRGRMLDRAALDKMLKPRDKVTSARPTQLWGLDIGE